MTTFVEGRTRAVDSFVVVLMATMDTLSDRVTGDRDDPDLLEKAMELVFDALTKTGSWNALLDRPA
jgi:hypothetical protein